MTGVLDNLIKLPTLYQDKNVIEFILCSNVFSKEDNKYILRCGFQIAIENRLVEMVGFYLSKIDFIDPQVNLISAYYIYISTGDSTIYKQIINSKKYEEISMVNFFQSQYPEVIAVYSSEEEIYHFIKLLEDKNDKYYYKLIMNDIINGAIKSKSTKFVINLLELNNNDADDNILFTSILNDKFTLLYHLMETGHATVTKIKKALYYIKQTINQFILKKDILNLGYLILKEYLSRQ